MSLLPLSNTPHSIANVRQKLQHPQQSQQPQQHTLSQLPQYSDNISELPKNNKQSLDENQQYISNLFLGMESAKSRFSVIKFIILLLLILAMLAPIPILKTYNQNIVYAAKGIIIFIALVIMYFV